MGRKRYVHPEFGLCVGTNPRSMPVIFVPLLDYHSEQARGLVHTVPWKMKMEALQQQFDRWVKSTRSDKPPQ